MNFNEQIHTHLRTGGGDRWCSSAVVTERGITYVQYDSIRIGNATDGSRGVSLQFVWGGVAVAWTRLHGAAMLGLKYVTSEPLKGRIRMGS